MSYWIEISDRTDLRQVAVELGATDLDDDVRPEGLIGDLKATFRPRTIVDADDAQTEFDMQIAFEPSHVLDQIRPIIDLVVAARRLSGVRRGGLIADDIPVLIWQSEPERWWYNRSFGRTTSPDFETALLQALKAHELDPTFASEDEIVDGVFTPEPLEVRAALALARLEQPGSPPALAPEDGMATLTSEDVTLAAWAAVGVEQQLHRYGYLDHVAALAEGLTPLLVGALRSMEAITIEEATLGLIDPTPHEPPAPYPMGNADLASSLRTLRNAYLVS